MSNEYLKLIGVTVDGRGILKRKKQKVPYTDGTKKRLEEPATMNRSVKCRDSEEKGKKDR